MTDLDHFTETLGNLPDPIRVLAEQAPEALAGYTQFRKAAYADREGGLDLATKELFLVVLDVIVDNEDGALNHLNAGLRAGLHPNALLDALLLTMMVTGISTWGKAGHRVLEAAIERAEAL